MNTTIVIIRKGDKILLGKKKRGFALGKYIGIGGKQENGEPIDTTMVRETREEICITPTAYSQVGLITFDTYYKGRHENLILNIYLCTDYTGTPTETDEILPEWFDADNIPYDKMLEDDILWMEKVLRGELVAGHVRFSPELVMMGCDIHSVSESELKEIIEKYKE